MNGDEFEQYCMRTLLYPVPQILETEPLKNSPRCDTPVYPVPQILEIEPPKNSPRSDKTHTCDYCQKKFIYLGSLRKHIVEHFKGDKITCAWCLRVFYDQSTFKRHVKNHKFYKCKKCDCQFFLRNDFIKHIC